MRKISFLFIMVFLMLFMFSVNTFAQSKHDEMRKRENAVLDAVVTQEQPWKGAKYKDEFGDPTGSKYIYQMVEGMFQNSAGESRCYVTILVSGKYFYPPTWDFRKVVIFLQHYNRGAGYETYSRSSQKIYDSPVYFKMKNSVGKTEIYNEPDLWSWSETGGIQLSPPADFIKFVIVSKGYIKVGMQINGGARYQFKFDATGFRDFANSYLLGR